VEGPAAKPVRPCVPPPPSAPGQAAHELESKGDEGEASEPFNLQPLWDDRTHNVTSFEELAEPEAALEQRADAAAEPPSELASDEESSYNQDPRYTAEGEYGAEREYGAEHEYTAEREYAADEQPLSSEPEPPPVLERDLPLREHVRPPPRPGLPPPFLIREPDTSGHRAYTSTLQPAHAGQLSRFAVPVALAVGVLLLIGQVVRIARREPSPPRDVAVAEAPARAPRREPPPAVQPEREVPPAPAVQPASAVQPEREVLAVRASASDAPPALAEPSLAGATASAGAAASAGASASGLLEPTPAPAVGIATAPAPPTAAPEAEPPSTPPVEEEAPALGIEAILPTLSADDAEPTTAPRAATKSRRAKRLDARAARAQGPLPRSIDETDPYLE